MRNRLVEAGVIALLGHGVDGYTGTTQCADHPDRAVLNRISADPDQKDRQTGVKVGGA